MLSHSHRENRRSSLCDPLPDELRKEFDEVAPIYARVRQPSEEVLQTLCMFLLPRKGTTVLEIGCGTGSYATALAETGARVWGIDFSPGMLGAARSQDPWQHVTWVCGRVEQPPFSNASFDFAFSVGLVHLVTLWKVMFTEAFRVLRCDGVLCPVTKKHEHIRQRFLARYFPSITRVNVERFPLLKEITHSLQEIGFSRVVRRSTVRQTPITEAYIESVRQKTDSALRRIPEREFREGLVMLEHDASTSTLFRQIGRVFIWARKREK